MLELQASFQPSRPSSARDFHSPPRSARNSTARSPSSSGKPGRIGGVSSAEKNLEIRGLREDNARLTEELRRSRADTCKARAEVAPLREENLRLSAEIRAILQSRLTSSEEAIERRPPWGASERFSRSFSSRSGARVEKLADTPSTFASSDGRHRHTSLQNSSPPRSLSSCASSPAVVHKSPSSRDEPKNDYREDRNVALENGSGAYMEPAEFKEALQSLASEPLRPPDLRGSRSAF